MSSTPSLVTAGPSNTAPQQRTHSAPPRAPSRTAGVRRAAVRFATIPSRSAATIGRGMQLFLDVLRYTITDSLSLKLPAGELAVQAWTLLKVTATPALLMAIPFGALITVVTSGLVNQIGASSLLGAAGGVSVVRQGARSPRAC